jgi:hypothetical protein
VRADAQVAAPHRCAQRSVVDSLSGGGRIRVVTCILRDGEQFKTLEELNKARAARRQQQQRRMPHALHPNPARLPRFSRLRWRRAWTARRRSWRWAAA